MKIEEIQNTIKKGCTRGRPYPWCSNEDDCSSAACWYNEAEQIQKLFEEEKREIYKELEELELIKGHHGHKKGEVILVSCARCTYEALKSRKG